MPYLKDPDHYTRGVGAIASIDHNRGRRNTAVMIERKTQLMDRHKLAQRALGGVPARGGSPQRPQARGPSKMMPQRGKYVSVPSPVMPVSTPTQFVVDPDPSAPDPTPKSPPQRGIVLTGGGGGGGGGGGRGGGGVGVSVAPPDPPQAADQPDGDDVDQLTPPPDQAAAPSSDSSSKMLLAVGVAAGLGALFLYFRKEE